MSAAIESNLDPSVLNAMRAWRRQTEKHAEEKLALLRRLRRQFETGSLPKLNETQVEQSFNEQIFARVFDYETLFSGDTLSYQIQAKRYVQANKAYPDFVVGTFAGDSGSLLACAELKSPDAPLDDPQDGNYRGLTPVQQAFQAVRGEASCRWILVSNYRELRLYEQIDLPNKKDDTDPYLIAVAKLCDIRDKNDLARLCAHFDKRALLGGMGSNTGESELMAARKNHHPAKPIADKKHHVRAVLLFTPRVEEDFPIFRLERRLRDALTNKPRTARLFAAIAAGAHTPTFVLAEGCISATVQDSLKVSLSGLGQLQVSVLKKKVDNKIESGWLVDVARLFVSLIDDIYHDLSEATRPGRVSPELREVEKVTLAVDAAYREKTMCSSGEAQTADVMGVDFEYTPVLDKGDQLVADVVSELAIYFRGKDGGGVGVDRDLLLKSFK